MAPGVRRRDAELKTDIARDQALRSTVIARAADVPGAARSNPAAAAAAQITPTAAGSLRRHAFRLAASR